MESSIPKMKSRNNIECYLKRNIKTLQTNKSFLITQINRLRRQFQEVSHNLELQRLKSLLRNGKALLNQQFRNSVNDYWKQRAESIIKSDSRNMFPKINKLYKPRNVVKIPKLRIPLSSQSLLSQAGINIQACPIIDNQYIIDDGADKLKLIGSHFEAVHARELSSCKTDEVSDELLRFRENETPTLLRFSEGLRADRLTFEETNNYFTTLDELTIIFRKLNTKRSSGLDSIPNIVLKHIQIDIIRQYCVIFNNLLNNYYFPSCWKISKVFPIIKKKKDPSDPSNYRPISLLPNIGKVFEIVISKSILFVCEEKEIIPRNQFGFKRNHSTVHAITKLVSDINWNLNAKRCTAACLVDIEKAFDTVWIDGLIYKLIRFEFSPHVTSMIISMVNGKKFVVTDRGYTTAEVFNVTNGLLQGTVTAPLLFNIHISEILRDLDDSLAFADDATLYASGSKIEDIQTQLQSKFDKFQAFCSNWKLQINYGKCETILFRTPIRRGNSDLRRNWKTLRITSSNGVHIESKTTVRYLGVQLDKFLYYNEHINTQLEKARKAFMALKSLFYSKYLRSDVKIICYQAFVRPILTYASPVWWNINPSYMEKLRVFERKCLRACMQMYRSEHSDFRHYVSNKKLLDASGVSRIDNVILDLGRNHFARSASVVENELISGLFYPNPGYFRNALETGYIPPETFLFLDAYGYLSDSTNVPIIYHAARRATDKRILYEPFESGHGNTNLRYCISIPERDKNNNNWLNRAKYWWLDWVEANT